MRLKVRGTFEDEKKGGDNSLTLFIVLLLLHLIFPSLLLRLFLFLLGRCLRRQGFDFLENILEKSVDELHIRDGQVRLHSFVDVRSLLVRGWPVHVEQARQEVLCGCGNAGSELVIGDAEDM